MKTLARIFLFFGALLLFLGLETYFQATNPLALTPKYKGPTPDPDNLIQSTEIYGEVIIYWHEDGSFTKEVKGVRKFYPKETN